MTTNVCGPNMMMSGDMTVVHLDSCRRRHSPLTILSREKARSSAYPTQRATGHNAPSHFKDGCILEAARDWDVYKWTDKVDVDPGRVAMTVVMG